MVIRKATREQIEAAMHAVNLEHDTTIMAGLSAYGNFGIRPVGRGWGLTLKLDLSTDPFHRHGARTYHRGHMSDNDGRGKRMTYVCWHGHRAFMRALYALAPEATIRSGFAFYKGSEHFEETHGETAYREIGSRYSPLAYSDACDCERGECPSRRPGRVAVLDESEVYRTADLVSDPPAGDQGEMTQTPEMALASAGVSEDRWSDYNRKINALLGGGR